MKLIPKSVTCKSRLRYTFVADDQNFIKMDRKWRDSWNKRCNYSLAPQDSTQYNNKPYFQIKSQEFHTNISVAIMWVRLHMMAIYCDRIYASIG